MKGNNWTKRVRRPMAADELLQVRDAARDLAEQGRHAPGKGRLVFQTVADVAFIGTAVIGGALAVIHLWKALSRSHAAEAHQYPRHEPEGEGHTPPRHCRLHAVAYDGDDSENRHSRRNGGTGRRQQFDGEPENQR